MRVWKRRSTGMGCWRSPCRRVGGPRVWGHIYHLLLMVRRGKEARSLWISPGTRGVRAHPVMLWRQRLRWLRVTVRIVLHRSHETLPWTLSWRRWRRVRIHEWLTIWWLHWWHLAGIVGDCHWGRLVDGGVGNRRRWSARVARA